MSAQHGTMTRVTLPPVLTPQAMSHGVPSTRAAQTGAVHSRFGGEAGHGVGLGLGSGALARAVERWRRALAHDQAQPAAGSAGGLPAGSVGSQPGSQVAGPVAGGSPALPSVDADALAALARRLDDSGCSYGRVSAARLDAVTRAYDRLETKMNAVLMAVTGTFLSTLAGLLLYYVRGAGQ